MKKCVNEVKRVDDILTNGGFELNVDGSWNDVHLLFKYYYAQGLKPKQAKEKIIPLIKNYDTIRDYKRLNSVMYYVRGTKDYQLLDINNIKIPKAAVAWFDEQDLDIEHKRLLFTFYAWSMIQKQYRSDNAYCKTTCDDSTRKKVKRASGVKTKKAIMDYYIDLQWDGYIVMPFFILGYNNKDKEGHMVNALVADKYLSQQNLEKYKNTDFLKLDTHDEFARLINRLDDMMPQYNLFINDVPTEGECYEVEASELLNTPGEWYFTHTSVTKKGEHKVKCKLCGKIVITRSHNYKQGVVCEDCRREYNRIKKQQSRARLDKK